MAKTKTSKTKSKSVKDTTSGSVDNENGKKDEPVQNRRSTRSKVLSTKAAAAAVDANAVNDLQPPTPKVKGGASGKGKARPQNITASKSNLARKSNEEGDSVAKIIRFSQGTVGGKKVFDSSKTNASLLLEGPPSPVITSTGDRTRES